MYRVSYSKLLARNTNWTGSEYDIGKRFVPDIPNAKRPPGNRVASSSRENSSNGELTVKTFWRNLMSGGRGCQGTFLEISGLFSIACILVISRPQVTRFETNTVREAFNRR